MSAKKSPRKGVVPGGQRTTTFSGSDWTLPWLPADFQRPVQAKRAANVHVGSTRFVVRRQPSASTSQPGCRPACSAGSSVEFSPGGVLLPRASLVRREIIEIAAEGQGRFPGLFSGSFFATAARVFCHRSARFRRRIRCWHHDAAANKTGLQRWLVMGSRRALARSLESRFRRAGRV